MHRDPTISKFAVPITNNGSGRDIPRIRPSVYDARYLRTTDLSKGSKIMTVSDPYSYMKHGLLHNGQEPFGELKNLILFIFISIKNNRESTFEQNFNFICHSDLN